MASYPSTLAYTYDILTPVAAQYGPSGPPMLVYTSRSLVVALHRCRFLWDLRRTNPWYPAGPCKTAMRDGTLRATSILIGRLVDRLAVA